VLFLDIIAGIGYTSKSSPSCNGCDRN